MTTVAPQPTSLSASLARLYPLGRRLVPKLALGLTAALLAAVLKLGIPQALQRIVNHSLGDQAGTVGLWLGVATVVLLGSAEALLVSLRRRFVIEPGTRLEASLRIRLFEHLTALPVDFHSRWTGGQLLARSVSDIRRFMRWL